MKDLIKQRLVGALILLALGVVFWPIIFAPPADNKMTERASVPPPPLVDKRELPSPNADGLRQARAVERPTEDAQVAVVPDRRDTTKDAAPKPSPEAKKSGLTKTTREQAPKKPKIDAQGLPVAWMLQVVSVSSEDKAKRLRQDMQDMDVRAYIKTVKVDGKPLYRLYIGPKYERTSLEQIKPKIDAHFGVNSLIKRYIP